MAADFRDREGITAPVYTDPRRETYAALGARRSMVSVFDPRAALAMARALASGHTQSATAGMPCSRAGSW